MKGNRFLVVWSGVLAFGLAASAWGGGFAVEGIGSKANSLGGAFRGLADDWSAAYWNPAGLALQKRSEITFSGYVISSRVKFTPRTLSNGYDFGFVSDSTVERFPFDRNVPFGTFSGLLRFPQLGKLSFGTAVFVPFHHGSRWNLFSLPYAFRGDTIPPFFFPERNYESSMRVVDVHPTVALSLMEGRLSLGAGVSIDRADLTFNRPILTPVEKSYQVLVGEVDTLKSIFDNLPEMKSRPEENVVSMTHLGVGSWGVGGNVGLLYKPNDKFSFGLSYRSPVRFKLKGEYHQRIFYPHNPSKRDARTQVGQIFPDPYRFIFDGQGKEILLGPDLARLTLDLPQDFGAGVALQPSRQWTVTADFAWVNWKKMDSLLVTFEDSNLTARLGYPSHRFNWKNTLRLSGGVAYQHKESWFFRVGYFFDQSPIPDSTFNPLILDVGNKHAFNAGVSYLTGSWELAYNFAMVVAQERNFSEVNGLFNNLPGLYKDTRFTSMASVSYRFDIKTE